MTGALGWLDCVLAFVRGFDSQGAVAGAVDVDGMEGVISTE